MRTRQYNTENDTSMRYKPVRERGACTLDIIRATGGHYLRLVGFIENKASRCKDIVDALDAHRISPRKLVGESKLIRVISA